MSELRTLRAELDRANVRLAAVDRRLAWAEHSAKYWRTEAMRRSASKFELRKAHAETLRVAAGELRAMSETIAAQSARLPSEDVIELAAARDLMRVFELEIDRARTLEHEKIHARIHGTKLGASPVSF